MIGCLRVCWCFAGLVYSVWLSSALVVEFCCAVIFALLFMCLIRFGGVYVIRCHCGAREGWGLLFSCVGLGFEFFLAVLLAWGCLCVSC